MMARTALLEAMMRTLIPRLASTAGVLLTALALLVGPTPLGYATSTAVGTQGLQGGWAVDDSGNVQFYHSLSSQFPIMHEAKAGWVRINFRLGACYPDWTSVGCNGRTALEAYSDVVANAQAQHLQILGLLSNESWPGDQTQWTANNAENNKRGTGDNAYIQAFAQNAAKVLAGHFAGKIGEWEVWNEPNAWTSNPRPGVYEGGSFIYPSNFAWLLKRSYAAIKNANASATVVSGGLFGHDIGGASMTVTTQGGQIQRVTKQGTFSAQGSKPGGGTKTTCSSSVSSGADYLCSTYKMGLEKAGWRKPYPLDHVGQHFYIDQGGLTSSSKITSYLEDVRNAYLSYEGTDSGKKTHMTEFGWETPLVDEATQAANLQTAYTTLKGAGYVPRSYWFSVQDVPEGGIYFGLVEGDYVAGGDTTLRKASFGAYLQYAQ